MKDKITNEKRDDEIIAQKLNQVAKQTHANSQFAADLEAKLRSAHRPKPHWFAAFDQVPPALRWVALMALLALVLSWSIRSLIPAPQPANDNTPEAPVSMTFTPAANALPDESATPATQVGGYDFRGAKLFVPQPLPDSPATAHVYLLHKEDQPATLEQARTLAGRFGIQGEAYTEPNYVFNTTNYVFSDGKQSLSVHSLRSFSYVADLAKTSIYSANTPNDNAEAIIREFLQTHSFDFQYRIVLSDFFDGYIVEPLAPDSIPMQYEATTTPSLIVMLDGNGEVLRLDASLMEYDAAPIGEYGIINAQQALEILMDDNILVGKTEFVHSPNIQPHDWYRSYPDDQPITAYGHITVYPAVDSGMPTLVLLNGVPAVGNTNGMESLEHYTFVKVNGKYFVENGVRKLNVETWDRKVQEMSFTGTLSRQGDQIILTSIDGSGAQYALIDPPADLPLGEISIDSLLDIYGVLEDGKLFWTFIRYFEGYTGGGGGGGGSGFGFYKLNLSGPPIPFPTPTPNPFTTTGTYVVQENDTLASIADHFGVSVKALMQANDITQNQVNTGQTLVIPNQQTAPINELIGNYTVQEGDTLSMIAQNYGTTIDELIRLNSLTETTIYIGQNLYVPITETTAQRMEDLRGYLAVSIHKKTDGSSFKEYILDVTQNTGSIIYTLDGSNLDEMDPHNGLPILVTGTINPTGKLLVESYKIPYPDLQFQILKGTQKIEQLGGQMVTVFTTEDGKSYVEYLMTNNMPNSSITGYEGDLIQQEVLIIPDEIFSGMPVAHIYQSAIVQENGPELQIRGNLIPEFPELDPNMPGDYPQPNLTINLVELAYFVSNPYDQVNDPNYDQRSPYIQPVWHFHGRYDDGTEFDVLIQALKQEFLLPEVVPNAGIG